MMLNTAAFTFIDCNILWKQYHLEKNGDTFENLSSWCLEKYNLFATRLAGFDYRIKNRFTNDQVTCFNKIIKDALEERNVLTDVFVNCESAYDFVQKEKFIQKLLNFGLASYVFI